MENTSYAFLAMLIPEEEYEIVKNNSYHSMPDAANALQWHLYNGLCENLNYPIHIINVLPVYSWPQYYKKWYIKKSTFHTRYSKDNISIKFLNFKVTRKYSKNRNIYTALMNWCKNNQGKKVLFVYTLSGTLLSVIHKVKIKYPELKVCPIVADLPNMRNLSSKKSLLNKILEKSSIDSVEKHESSVDFYVLLTKHMATYLNITKPFCVVEGIATDISEFGEKSDDTNAIKTVLYSGTLHKRFGVLNLVNAFRQIDNENYRLVLCGVGDCEEDIKKASLEDTRIQFLGQVSRKDVLNLQKKATVVVNPRQDTEEFTKYSFPSKNLEYLSSGTPLIAYKLDGIPDEYDEYIFYVKDNSIQELAYTILNVCQRSQAELSEHGKKAQSFVKNEKNEIVQTKKIIELVSSSV